MTRLLNWMVGFSKRICQLIILLISVVLLLNCISFVRAQNDTAIRVEWAAQYGDGSVVVHMSAPRGTTIESAQIRTDDANLNLNAPPITSDVTYWLVLDATQDMVNIGSLVERGLLNLVRSFQDGAFGIIIYDTNVTIIPPSSDLNAIAAALDSYDPQANPTGCIYDALTELANMPHPATEVWRVLLVSSSLTSQAACQTRHFTDFGVPIDVLAIGNQDTTALRSIANESQGIFLSSSVNQLQASWNSIDSQWSHPIYSLSSHEGAHISREGYLFITLSSGRQITAAIDLLVFDDILPDGTAYIPPTPLPPTNTPLPTDTPIPPTLTPIPVTVTPIATDIPTETQDPTQIAAVPISAPTEVIKSISPIPPTNSPQPLATQTGASQQVTETPSVVPNGNSTLINNLIIIIGGFAVGLVIIVVIYGLVRNSAEEFAARHGLENSKELTSKTPLPVAKQNFYEVDTLEPVGNGQGGVSAADQPDTEDLDNTEMENPQADSDGTQVWSIEDLQEAIRMPTVATLMASVDETLYDISGPRTLLGTGTACQIRFSEISAIAEEHILFDIDDDNKVTATLLTDQEVYINGKRLFHTKQLQSGDEIQLAPDIKMIFNYLED